MSVHEVQALQARHPVELTLMPNAQILGHIWAARNLDSMS